MARHDELALARRKRVFDGAVVLVYLVTWIGGWIYHDREVREKAAANYRNAEQAGFKSLLHEDGARAGVVWCLPLLPGVLLMSSYTSIGPLAGGGGVKLVLFYGFGSAELCRFSVWLA